MVLRLIRDVKAQDTTEYTLLLAFVVVIAAAIFSVSAQDVRTIWGVASATTQSAAMVASGS